MFYVGFTADNEVVVEETLEAFGQYVGREFVEIHGPTASFEVGASISLRGKNYSSNKEVSDKELEMINSKL